MNSIRKTLLPITTFVRIDVKRLFRDKVAIFFVFVFPLIFLLVFGTIFGGDNDISFKVALLNNSKSDFAKSFAESSKGDKVLRVDEKITTLDQAKAKMNRGELDATIILPEGFGDVTNGKYPSGEAQLLYDQNNESAGQTLSSVLDGIFKGINSQFVANETPFTVKAQSTATEGLSRFDYTFSGLLGFTLLSLGIFGPTTVFPRLKQRGVLRRYQTTTIKVWQYFTGNVISNAIVGLLAVALMFITALLFFDLDMRGDYFSFATITILGVTMLFGIGLALGGWAKNENQAAPLAQLVTFPMMFLSGVFFPTFLMPELLQKITKFIPLTPVIDGIRMIVTEGRTIFDIGPQLLVIGGWTLIIYIIAFKVFRWE
ncbi:ABC transporter permease [Candidatus Saccharibacteria bacterium]|nr:ABC transporter permease [Candidatus Saccharibacteria bacterium]